MPHDVRSPADLNMITHDGVGTDVNVFVNFSTGSDYCSWMDVTHVCILSLVSMKRRSASDASSLPIRTLPRYFQDARTLGKYFNFNLHLIARINRPAEFGFVDCHEKRDIIAFTGYAADRSDVGELEAAKDRADLRIATQ